MKHINYWLALLLIFSFITINAQEKKKFKIHTVAFYNLENLFDTINDQTKFDERSPMMEIKNNRSEIYKKKVENMARVISEIGADVSRNTPALIGICEIENKQVIFDLANDPKLINKDYGIVHYESPDSRGIDVALMYQKKLFTPIHTSSHSIKIYNDKTRKRVQTRDQLLVSGTLEDEMIHVIVNHWPSRSGGEARSRPKRVAAAKVNKRLIDSLQSIDPYAKIVIMGDLNDNPTNKSIKDVLKAERNRKNVGLKAIFNPYENMFRKSGLGTTAYRDAWSLFDQIMFTKPFLEKDYSSWSYYKAGIFNKAYLSNKKGRWKGYPLRSFADGGFTNGFSDHFPVYVYLIKEL